MFCFCRGRILLASAYYKDLDSRARLFRNTLGRFQWSFLWILNVLIIHEFLTAGYLVLWTTVPVSRGFYSMPKLREFVHDKSKTLFRIASPFWTNIEYSHRVSTSIFVEIILWVLTPESEYEFSLSVETSRFSMPKLENFPNHKAKIIIEIAWHF